MWVTLRLRPDAAGVTAVRLSDVSVHERNDLVTALRAIPGVADVELLAGSEAGDPADAGTVKLSLASGADEVSVATQVNQLLRQEFGLGVDAGRVQLLEETAPQRLLAVVPEPSRTTTTEVGLHTRGGRLLIQRMQLVSAAPGVSAAVTLVVDGQTFVGEVDGAASAGSVHRSVAEATLQAVESVAGGLARFHLDGVEVADLGGDQVVLSVVSMSSAFGVERLIGTSAVREDVRQAVIRATLDSLNRRLEAVLSRG